MKGNTQNTVEKRVRKSCLISQGACGMYDNWAHDIAIIKEMLRRKIYYSSFCI